MMAAVMAMFEDLRLGVYCCGHVFRNERAVLLVSHEERDWQFVCGGADHNDPDEPYHVHVGALVSADQTLHDVADLPPGYEAERRSVGDTWVKTKSGEANA